MNRTPVALDAELVAKLTADGGEVPLTDAGGKPVGVFLSPEMYRQMREAMSDQATAEVTLEEFRRSLADPQRHTMDEVFKLLEGE